MHTTKHYQREIVDEIRRIRSELRTIATSLYPPSDATQRVIAEKKITELEQRIDALEARQSRRL